MNIRVLFLCLAIGGATLPGCRVLGHMWQPPTRGLGTRMSELKSRLSQGEMTLDEYEREKQTILRGEDQLPLMNAR